MRAQINLALGDLDDARRAVERAMREGDTMYLDPALTRIGWAQSALRGESAARPQTEAAE